MDFEKLVKYKLFPNRLRKYTDCITWFYNVTLGNKHICSKI